MGAVEESAFVAWLNLKLWASRELYISTLSQSYPPIPIKFFLIITSIFIDINKATLILFIARTYSAISYFPPF